MLSLLGWDLKQEVLCLHTRKIKSYSSKKKRPLWPVIMVDNAPTHERGKMVKSYKNELPRKQIEAAELCRKTYSKNDKKME